MPSENERSTAGFKYDYADVNGVKLHYVTNGDRANRPMLLFIHGFFSFSHYWRDHLIEFGKDHFAVAPDMRGYNLSSRPAETEQYKLKYLIEDVRQLNEKLNAGGKFVLVGHDWGGLVAYVFAMHYPELIEKLIVFNAPHPQMFEREVNKNPWQQHSSNYALLANGYGLPGDPTFASLVPSEREKVEERFATGWIAEQVKSGHYTEEDRQMWIDAWTQPGALKAGEQWYDANDLNPPFNETHPASGVAKSWSTSAVTQNAKTLILDMPTLIVWGVNDEALPPGNLTGFDDYFTNIKIRLWPHYGHDLAMANAAEVNAEIRNFLEDRDSEKVRVIQTKPG
jgi:pimeloyl-ACP methyl ester carboxylesterase